MVSLEELCASACDSHTKMADAMLVACVNMAIETKHQLSLRQEDVDRFIALITAQPE